jgi:hypothetical protein
MGHSSYNNEKSCSFHINFFLFRYISLLSEAYKSDFNFLSLNEVLPLALACVKIAE